MDKDKEEQIQKIKDLLASKDEANVELGLQLMEVLGLLKDIPQKFKENSIMITENSILGVGIRLPNFLRDFLDELDNILNKFNLRLLYNNNICSSIIELFYLYYQFSVKIPKIILKVLMNEKKCISSSEAICNKKEIEEIIIILNQLNNFGYNELKDYYQPKFGPKGLLKKDSSFFGWIELRQKSFDNPIQYEVQPFDENYSLFKVQVVLNLK